MSTIDELLAAWYHLEPSDDRSPAEVADHDSLDAFIEAQMNSTPEVVECAWCTEPMLSPYSTVGGDLPDGIVVHRGLREWAYAHDGDCTEQAFDEGWARS